MSEPEHRPGRRGRYPGQTIRAQLTGDHALGVFNVLGNVAMFVPLGWLGVLVAERYRFLAAVIAGVGLSAAIEVVQSFVGRIADIDDVILNGAGGVLGACAALLIRAARRSAVNPGAGTPA